MFIETRASVQLPRIDIPKFSGEFTKWENFRDVFESLVASRTDLSNVQKLHYLKANLTGDASLILANTHVTDANYNAAWELLKRRFDNPQAIVNAYLQEFMDIPGVGSQSVSEIKNLRDKTSDIYTALLNLKRPVDQWEDLLVFVTVSKLDKVTRRDWELSLGDDIEIPNFAKLDMFLTSRIRALDVIQDNSRPSNKSDSKKSTKIGNVKTHQISSNNAKCTACEGNHPLNHCKLFLNQSISQCVELLKRHKCCFNCLRQGHFPGSCKSKNVCTLCKQKHHTLIHREKTVIENTLPLSTNETDQNISTSNVLTAKQDRSPEGLISSNNSLNTEVNTTLLPTASVLLKSNSGRSVRVRALLDQGSQASFVTESVVQLLRADRTPTSIDVSGIGGLKAGTIKSCAILIVELCSQKGPVLPIKALVLPKLTNYMPAPATISTCSYLTTLTLADSEPSSSKKIDLLIDADYYGAILREGLIQGLPGRPTAQLTIFGWVISGPLSYISQGTICNRINANHVFVLDQLNDPLRKFWEVEEVPSCHVMSDEEARYESHFVETHFRLPNGYTTIRR